LQKQSPIDAKAILDRCKSNPRIRFCIRDLKRSEIRSPPGDSVRPFFSGEEKS
jgi:hypothetical protein